MDKAYKIYASVLNEKIKVEVEEKAEEEQFSFRQGRGTPNAIYVINHVVNRSIKKKKEKVFAFFADLKVAFDRVNRGKLRGMLKKVGIKEKGEKNNGDV